MRSDLILLHWVEAKRIAAGCRAFRDVCGSRLLAHANLVNAGFQESACKRGSDKSGSPPRVVTRSASQARQRSKRQKQVRIGLTAKCGYCFLQFKEMKYAVAVSVLLAGLTSAALAVETPPSPTPAASAASSSQSGSARLIDQLDVNQLKELLDKLRTNYVDAQALTNDELNQAAIKLLLAKLGPGVRVQTQSEFARAIPVRPFRYDVVSNRFSYIRLGTLKDNTLTQLDNALGESRSRNVDGLIIDLRTVSEDSDYDLANNIISRFVGNGETTFNLITKGAEPKKFTSQSTPLYHGPIAVLIDRQTAGAAEVIAGVLKTKDRALLIGQTTAGRAVKYKTEPLGNLQVSVAESEVQIAALPLIFPGGVVPDIAVNVPQEVENQVLNQSDSGPLDPFITDEERPRLNEAALVNGTNPELDAYEEQEAGKTSKAPIKDESLQHAIDFLITLSLYKK